MYINVYNQIIKFKGNYQILKRENLLPKIIKITFFLDKYYNNISWSQRLWHIKNNHYEIIKCSGCNNNLAKFYMGRAEYTCCSISCKIIIIKRTNLIKYGVDNVAKLESVKIKNSHGVLKTRHLTEHKRKKTCLEKYGTEFPLQSEKIKEKIKKTNIKKYGVNNYAKTKQYKEIMIKKGLQIPDNQLSFFQLYKKQIRNITRKYKKQLFIDWDGYDYYDKEYIKDYTDYKNSPTIDHKISVFFGFNNNISAEEIGNINNLCITKRSINAQKSISSKL